MIRLRLAAFRNNQIHGFGAGEFHVGASGIEMGVVRNQVALLAGDAKQNSLGGASLVGWDYVAITEDVLDRSAKPVEALASGVAFVRFHHRCPLMRGHRAGAGIG